LFGGPVGAAAGTALQNMLTKGSKQGVKRAGELFASPEFKAMIQEQARKGEISQRSINKIAISRAWNKFKEAIR
jgi:hypothetical protein